MTYDEALAAIRANLDTAKANGDAYVGLPVAELDLVLTSLLEITPSEAGAVLAAVRYDHEPEDEVEDVVFVEEEDTLVEQIEADYADLHDEFITDPVTEDPKPEAAKAAPGPLEPEPFDAKAAVERAHDENPKVMEKLAAPAKAKKPTAKKKSA